MNEEFIAIKAFINAFPNLSQERKHAILAAVDRPLRRTLIKRKEVLAMLEVSAPTLRTIISRGLIHPIILTPRKIRFDRDEVFSYLNSGMTLGHKEGSKHDGLG